MDFSGLNALLNTIRTEIHFDGIGAEQLSKGSAGRASTSATAAPVNAAWWNDDQQRASLTVRNILGTSATGGMSGHHAAQRYTQDRAQEPMSGSGAVTSPAAPHSISTVSWALRSPTSRKLLEMAERLAVEDFHSAHSAVQRGSPSLLPVPPASSTDTYLHRSPTVGDAVHTSTGESQAAQNLLHTLDRAAARVESLVPDTTAFFPHLLPSRAEGRAEGREETGATGQGKQETGVEQRAASQYLLNQSSAATSLTSYSSLPSHVQSSAEGLRAPAPRLQPVAITPAPFFQRTQAAEEAKPTASTMQELSSYGILPSSRRSSVLVPPPPPPPPPALAPAAPAAPAVKPPSAPATSIDSTQRIDGAQRDETVTQPPNAVLVSKLASALTALQDAARMNEQLRAQLKEAEARAVAGRGGGGGGQGGKGLAKPPVKGGKAAPSEKAGSSANDVAVLADAVARLLQERGLVGGSSDVGHRAAAVEDRETVVTGATGGVSHTATEYTAMVGDKPVSSAAGSNMRPPTSWASQRLPSATTTGRKRPPRAEAGELPQTQTKKPRPPKQGASVAAQGAARARSSSSAGRPGFGSSAPSHRTLKAPLRDGVVQLLDAGEGQAKPRGPLSPSGQRISSVTASRLASRSVSPTKASGPSLSSRALEEGSLVEAGGRGKRAIDLRDGGAEAGAAGAVVALPSPPSSRSVTSPASSHKGGPSSLAPPGMGRGVDPAAPTPLASYNTLGLDGYRTPHAYSDFVREDDEGRPHAPARAEVFISPDGVLRQEGSTGRGPFGMVDADIDLPPSLTGTRPASIAASILARKRPAMEVSYQPDVSVYPPLHEFGYAGGHSLRLPSRPLLPMYDRRDSAVERHALVDSMLEKYRRELSRGPLLPPGLSTTAYTARAPAPVHAHAPSAVISSTSHAPVVPSRTQMPTTLPPSPTAGEDEEDEQQDYDRIARIAKMASAMQLQAEGARADSNPSVTELREQWRRALVAKSAAPSSTARSPPPATGRAPPHSDTARTTGTTTSKRMPLQAAAVATNKRRAVDARSTKRASSHGIADRDTRALQALAGMTARLVDREEAQRQAVAEKAALADAHVAGGQTASRGRAWSSSSGAASEAWLKYYGTGGRATGSTSAPLPRSQDVLKQSAGTISQDKLSALRRNRSPQKPLQQEGAGATGFSASAMASALDGDDEDDVGQLLAAASAAVGVRMHPGPTASAARTDPPAPPMPDRPPALASRPVPAPALLEPVLPVLPVLPQAEGAQGLSRTSLPMDFRSKLLAASFTAAPRGVRVIPRADRKLATSVTSPTPEPSVVGLSARESSRLGLADDRMVGAEVLSQSMRRVESALEDSPLP